MNGYSLGVFWERRQPFKIDITTILNGSLSLSTNR
jgi:hypothetical protein